jgi:quercetin dioxygenase-like cupin family protein
MNVLENVPYGEEAIGRRVVADEKHLLIMQIALKPGQIVPRHNANSNVNLLVLKGAVSVDLDGTENPVREGDLLPVEFQTPMMIKNSGSQDATFLVIKTPNPSEMAK